MKWQIDTFRQVSVDPSTIPTSIELYPDDDMLPMDAIEMFENDTYTVVRRELAPDLKWLSIRRNDRSAIHDWRDLQEIKNQLSDPEWEAIEIYPAESRLVDDANQYHLWVMPKIGIGFDQGRRVSEKPETETAKYEQRPFK
jgi:hypothetical protein